MVVEVALDLEGEELGGHHQPLLGVPVGQAVVGGVGAERAAGVLVEADRERDLGGAGLDRLGGRSGSALPRGAAAVVDADERDAGQPELADERRRVAAVAATAGGELDVAPRDAGVGERARGLRSAPSRGR